MTDWVLQSAIRPAWVITVLGGSATVLGGSVEIFSFDVLDTRSFKVRPKPSGREEAGARFRQTRLMGLQDCRPRQAPETTPMAYMAYMERGSRSQTAFPHEAPKASIFPHQAGDTGRPNRPQKQAHRSFVWQFTSGLRCCSRRCFTSWVPSVVSAAVFTAAAHRPVARPNIPTGPRERCGRAT